MQNCHCNRVVVVASDIGDNHEWSEGMGLTPSVMALVAAVLLAAAAPRVTAFLPLASASRASTSG